MKPEGENDGFKVTKKAYTDSGIIFRKFGNSLSRNILDGPK